MKAMPEWFQKKWPTPEQKALEMLHRLLPEKEWQHFEKHKALRVSGKWANYEIMPDSRTKIISRITGKCTGHACLQLSIAAPSVDRMIAEYLLVKSSESFYWKTANTAAPPPLFLELLGLLIIVVIICVLVGLLYHAL